ncbi:3-isopropylmalate dehydratase small subunit [Hoeflea poritis]|uniref:3-isopropylmalate dehydratase n=1 Tax=Hoeflea poritis TaxID=2993659 RepID=A0ABT4VH56_9HYPH|nr:3-isopropylmalate dehydratase small subunit [Hoeflea poritis]MDA4844022.1 3-isopropylmalate dehydratase small subunit [Hoeflea poritis]
MSGWTRHTGKAVALDLESVDTDQLITARFMSTPRAEGYGRFLLYDLRFDSEEQPVPDFPLNRVPDASILVARRNFGSGSSREAAVYALVDFGIRTVIAPSFGDIFASNAVNNGLLPAQADEAEIDALIDELAGGAVHATVKLEHGEIEIGSRKLAFTLDAAWREKLINGWDDIDLTEQHHPAIARYRDRRAKAQPWAFPAGQTAG